MLYVVTPDLLVNTMTVLVWADVFGSTSVFDSSRVSCLLGQKHSVYVLAAVVCLVSEIVAKVPVVQYELC